MSKRNRKSKCKRKSHEIDKILKSPINNVNRIDNKAKRIITSTNSQTMTIGLNELENIILRSQIVALSRHTNKTQTTIANNLNCSRKMASTWSNADLSDPINVLDKARVGRPPTVINKHQQNILNNCNNEEFSARNYSNEFHLTDVPISKSHVNRITIKNNKNPYKNKLAGAMDDDHRIARLNWCRGQEHKTVYDWKKYLITDSKIWRISGGRNTQNQRTYLDKGDNQKHQNQHMNIEHMFLIVVVNEMEFDS